MKKYIVHISAKLEGMTRKDVIELWQKDLFTPLRSLAIEMGRQGETLNIKRELEFIGAAVVYASDKAVEAMINKGFKVMKDEAPQE